jgi:O-antigen/teichoic acid export membrane protein
MPWYGFIHPLLAIGTLWLGLVTAQTSLSKGSDWDFPLRRQRNRSIIFLLLCVANFAAALRGIHKEVMISAHMTLSIVVLVAAFLAALVTFTRSKPGETPPLMRWHAMLSIVAIAVILTMGFLGGLKLIGS